MSRVGQRDDREDEEEGKDMGRHRRSRSATGSDDPQHSRPQDSPARDPYALELYRGDRAPKGIAPYLNPEAYAEAKARAHAYLFADDAGPRAGGGFAPSGGSSGRRRRRGGRPVRAGLLGTAAALALGTTAVATGVVPGLAHYKLGGGTDTTGGERVQAADSPGNTAAEQGGTSGSADRRTAGAGAGRTATGPQSPAPSVSASPSSSPSTSASPTATPSKTASATPAPRATAAGPRTTPSHAAGKAPAPVTVPAQAAAEAEVLGLVNAERSKVGCSPLSANPSLTKLAEAFSDDMAARGFFDHTDPDGKSPWDRAAAAGISNLGGENIARGQADAAAVMQAWMNSPGHKANILNCDFKTLGVGVHFGSGGPWWTQDFGY